MNLKEHDQEIMRGGNYKAWEKHKIYIVYGLIRLISLYNNKMQQIILHYPTLKTVMLVEHVLSKGGAAISKNELKRRLPVKIMHQTLNLVLEYLESSGKIMVGSKGISWLQQDNPKLRAMLQKAVRVA